MRVYVVIGGWIVSLWCLWSEHCTSEVQVMVETANKRQGTGRKKRKCELDQERADMELTRERKQRIQN